MTLRKDLDKLATTLAARAGDMEDETAIEALKVLSGYYAVCIRADKHGAPADDEIEEFNFSRGIAAFEDKPNERKPVSARVRPDA